MNKRHIIFYIQKIAVYLFFLSLVCYLPDFSTKQLLIFMNIVLIYFMYRWTINKLLKKNIFKELEYGSPQDEMTFNDVLVKEIFSIKYKLNEMLIDKDDWHKKSKNFGTEIKRKSFLRRDYIYSEYSSIVNRTFYTTSNGDHGSIIIFKQKSENLGISFDPIDRCMNEEILIQLHSAGPKSYKNIKKLNIGDELVADIYDPELGYCSKPLITVVSIDKDNDSSYSQDVTVEISSHYQSEKSIKVERTINLPIEFDDLDHFS